MDSSIGTKSASTRAQFSTSVTVAPTKVLQLLDFAAMLGSTERSAGSFGQLSGRWNPSNSEPSWRDDRFGSDLQDSVNNPEPSHQTSAEQNRDSREAGEAAEDADSPTESQDPATPPALPISEKPLESKDIADKDSFQNSADLGVVPDNDGSDEPKGKLVPTADQEDTVQSELTTQHTRLATDSQTEDLASVNDPKAAGKAVLETARNPDSPGDQQPSIPTDLTVARAGKSAAENTSPGDSEASAGVAVNAEENLASDSWDSATKAAQASDSAVPRDGDPKEARESRITNQRRQRLARWFERSQPNGLDQDASINRSSSDRLSSDVVSQKANDKTVSDSPSAAWMASSLHSPSNITNERSIKTDPVSTGQLEGEPKIPGRELRSQSVSVSSETTASLVGSPQSSDSAAWSGSSAQPADIASLGTGESRGNERPAVTNLPSQNANALHPNAEAAATEPNPNLQAAERLRLIQRVARSFQRVGAEGGTVQLRLHPPELGSLSMQVRIDGRNMVAQLTTESVAAREVIMESLPQLRSRLVEQGFEVMQITVEVADQNAFGSPGESPGQSNFGSPNGQSSQGYPHGALDLRRSAHLRRQLEATGLPTSAMPVSKPAGMGLSNRGIDLHA